MRFFMTALIGALLASVSGAAVRDAAQRSPGYNVMRSHSSVEFTILKWKVFREVGRFTRFDGILRYDAERPDIASIELTVEAASVQTDMPLRDRILRSDDFFDAEAHPTIEFRSKTVRPVGADRLSVTGLLTIRGITKEITVPVTVIGVATHPHIGRIAGFETSFVVDRTDFGIDGARWSGGRDSLSEEVEVRVRVGSAGPSG